MLCDFGISRVVIESKTMTGTTSLKGNIRWMAVELLHPHAHAGDAAKHQFHTRESDVWAYGMVVNVSRASLMSIGIPSRMVNDVHLRKFCPSMFLSTTKSTTDRS